MKGFSIPRIAVSAAKIVVPKVVVPKIEAAGIKLPDVKIPEVNLSNLNSIPGISMPDLSKFKPENLVKTDLSNLSVENLSKGIDIKSIVDVGTLSTGLNNKISELKDTASNTASEKFEQVKGKIAELSNKVLKGGE